LRTHTDQDSGTFFSVTGAGNVDGGFAINGVPAGPYYFQFQNEFFALTNESSLDLGTNFMGRPLQTQAPNPTPLTINASGLNAWAANNTLSMTSTNMGMSVGDLTTLGSNVPTVGATSAQLNFNYGLANAPRGLVEAAQGDTLVLTQNQVLGPPAHRAATASATVSGLTQIGGQSSIVNAVFAPLTPTSLTLDWRVTQFESYGSAVNASANVYSHILQIYGVNGQTASTPVSGATADLLYLPLAGGSPDFTGTVQYGNPFSNTVTLNGAYSCAFSVMVQAPGAAATPFYVSVSRSGPLSSLTGPILPVISPVRNVTVNGQAANQALTGVGTSPVISWTAPALGTATRYGINVFLVSNVGGQTRVSAVGNVRLKGTRARIPPGLMTAGNTYQLVVVSSMATGGDVEKRPFGAVTFQGNAEAVLGLITP
jgi:hypothetical protein